MRALRRLRGRPCSLLRPQPPFGVQAAIDNSTLLNGRRVQGIVQGDAVPQIFIPKLIDLYKAGHFPFDRLVKIYDFADIERAFDDSKQGRTIKPVLRIEAV